MKEKILVSAVLYEKCPDPVKSIRGKISVSNKPKNEGVIICALRHFMCLAHLNKAGFRPIKADLVDGFIAINESGNKEFVDRSQAGAIAFRAGQIDIESPLFSEAIYPDKEYLALANNQN